MCLYIIYIFIWLYIHWWCLWLSLKYIKVINYYFLIYFIYIIYTTFDDTLIKYKYIYMAEYKYSFNYYWYLNTVCTHIILVTVMIVIIKVRIAIIMLTITAEPIKYWLLLTITLPSPPTLWRRKCWMFNAWTMSNA